MQVACSGSEMWLREEVGGHCHCGTCGCHRCEMFETIFMQVLVCLLFNRLENNGASGDIFNYAAVWWEVIYLIVING